MTDPHTGAPGYKHGTPEKADIAKRFTILRTQVGSGVHGVSVASQDDRDEMGLCVEPPEYVVGLKRFDQYEYRTQPVGRRSGPGDLDLMVYSLRKWMRLALQGNPTVLLPLFVPESEVVEATEHGHYLRAHPELVLSRKAGLRFIGYLGSQRAQLLGLRGKKHTNRPELAETYGFDTKFAYHMVRLGVQGVELLADGKITLPMPEPWRTWLTELRQGKHTKDEALNRAEELEARLRGLMDTSPLPIEPDRAVADAWLIKVYQDIWSS